MLLENILLELAKGAGLLLGISYLVSWNYQKDYDSEPVRQITNGLFFGAAVIIGMMTPLQLSDGIIFDARTVVLGVGSAIGGPITAITSVFLGLIYRLYIGGAGAFIGSLSMIFSALIGLVFWHYTTINSLKINIKTTLLLGFVIHLVNVILFLFLPLPILKTTLHIGLPMLLIFTPATAILFKMLHTEIQWKEDKIGKLDAILQRDKALRGYTDILTQTINTIALTVEKRDPYTAIHQSNVALL